MHVEILVTQSTKQPDKCNVDVIFSKIPFVVQMVKRIDDCPLPFAVGYLVACSIADHINLGRVEKLDF